MGAESGAKHLQTKESQRVLATRTLGGAGRTLPRSLQRERSLAHTLILDF